MSQLSDLIKPLDQMTEQELLERLRQVRHNREVLRPAARKRVEAVEKKASKVAVNKMDKLLGGLSASERDALIKQLQEGA
jgi:hypothetical protein